MSMRISTIATKTNMFHCDGCKIFLNTRQREHACRPVEEDDEYPICLENIFQTGCEVLPCSHKLHEVCLKNLINTGTTTCPYCREPIRQDQADSDDDNGLSLHWWQQDNEEVWGDLMGNLEDQLPLDLDLHGQDIENRLTHLVAQGLNTVTADITSASGTPLETRLRILAHWISRRTGNEFFMEEYETYSHQ